jgi:predicted transcriptional regulator
MRVTWLSTLSDCAGIYAAMCKVTKTEEHIEVGFSRMRRDLCDSNKTKSF